jgi:NAD(P) transhydrogenase subunit alpha
MNPNELALQAARIADRAQELALNLQAMAAFQGLPLAEAVEPFIFLLAIFLMACFVGYYVVWNVTSALHSPLMAVTNAISSVIIVGAMLATGLGTSAWAQGFGFIAVVLASVNIFGGFMVTQRMLAMFKPREAKAPQPHS